MKRSRTSRPLRSAGLLAAVLLAPALAYSAGARAAQDERDDDGPASHDPAIVVEAMKLAQPGPEHKWLSQLAGDWSETVTFHGGAGEQGDVAVQQAGASRMVFGNRFLESRWQSATEGVEVEGVQYLGFDRRQGRYTLVRIDTMATHYVSASGRFRPGDEKLTLHGVDEDPILGAQNFRFELTLESADRLRTELILRDGEGNDQPLMTIVAERKPG